MNHFQEVETHKYTAADIPAVSKNNERGYSPSAGLPKGCGFAHFEWASCLGNAEEQQQYVKVLERCGLDEYTAWKIIKIQTTDPRFRTEVDWQFLESSLKRLHAQQTKINGG